MTKPAQSMGQENRQQVNLWAESTISSGSLIVQARVRLLSARSIGELKGGDIYRKGKQEGKEYCPNGQWLLKHRKVGPRASSWY